MTLQAQIARRLYAIRTKNSPAIFQNFDTADADTQARWDDMATEVVRWMEWARRECDEYAGHYGQAEWPPLTLPPEGWKP